MKNKLKIYLSDIVLIIFVGLFGFILMINRIKGIPLDFYLRVELEHFIAFLFMSLLLFTVSYGFYEIFCKNYKKKNLNYIIIFFISAGFPIILSTILEFNLQYKIEFLYFLQPYKSYTNQFIIDIFGVLSGSLYSWYILE